MLGLKDGQEETIGKDIAIGNCHEQKHRCREGRLCLEKCKVRVWSLLEKKRVWSVYKGNLGLDWEGSSMPCADI